MLTCTMCKNRILNTKLNEYCRTVMNNAIKTITDKTNLEKNKPVISSVAITPYKDDKNSSPNYSLVFLFFGFLSMSTFYLYKRIK